MSTQSQSVSELLRPQQFSDLILPQKQLDHLQRMAERRSIMNMLFCGAPGTGKTSAARILMKSFPGSSRGLDGSNATGVHFVREHIEKYVRSNALSSDDKVFFIDKAEHASKQAQRELRSLIEGRLPNCRFIFAANNPSKLIPAIRSTLIEFSFDTPVSDRPRAIACLIAYYRRELSTLGINWEEQRLNELVRIYFPDLRSIAEHIELEFSRDCGQNNCPDPQPNFPVGAGQTFAPPQPIRL